MKKTLNFVKDAVGKELNNYKILYQTIGLLGMSWDVVKNVQEQSWHSWHILKERTNFYRIFRIP